MRCIKCGSRKVSLVKYNEGYSFTKGIVGTVVFGSVGAVARINGKTSQVYHCNECGQDENTIMPDVIETTRGEKMTICKENRKYHLYNTSFLLALIIVLLWSVISIDAAETENKCGENAIWQTTNEEVIISGYGAMEDYQSYSITGWIEDVMRKDIFSVIIQPGITHVGNFAFCDTSTWCYGEFEDLYCCGRPLTSAGHHGCVSLI